jgi:nucleoid-associated protein YgaU
MKKRDEVKAGQDRADAVLRTDPQSKADQVSVRREVESGYLLLTSPYVDLDGSQNQSTQYHPPRVPPLAHGGILPDTVAPAQEEHQVVRGDNLWKVARRQLKEHGEDGSPNAIMKRIHAIIEANKEKYPELANSPNLIVPGMKLKLPR